MDWRKNTHWSGVNKYIRVPGKLSEIHSIVWFFSNPGDKVLKCKIQRDKSVHTLTRKQILSPGLENNGTLQCISDSFPCTLIYLFFLENCWNSTLILSFSPIKGTSSRLLLKLHVARIWECHIGRQKSIRRQKRIRRQKSKRKSRKSRKSMVQIDGSKKTGINGLVKIDGSK